MLGCAQHADAQDGCMGLIVLRCSVETGQACSAWAPCGVMGARRTIRIVWMPALASSPVHHLVGFGLIIASNHGCAGFALGPLVCLMFQMQHLCARSIPLAVSQTGDESLGARHPSRKIVYRGGGGGALQSAGEWVVAEAPTLSRWHPPTPYIYMRRRPSKHG